MLYFRNRSLEYKLKKNEMIKRLIKGDVKTEKSSLYNLKIFLNILQPINNNENNESYF